MNVFNNWAKARGKSGDIEEYEPKDLDSILCKFYGEVRKKDGTDYEPNCLRVMQSGLHRHLLHKHYPKSIISDIEFTDSNRILEGKARLLRQNGKGKRPNASQTLTQEEGNELCKSEKLGKSNAIALLHTMWFINIQHFGQRGQTRARVDDDR